MTHELAAAMCRADFEAAEAVVAEGRDSFIRVGQALLSIRDGRGYRYRGYPSFERYLEQHWGIRRSSGFELLADAEVRATLESPHGGPNLDNGVGRFRPGALAPLAPLPAEQQVQAVQQLMDEGQATRAQVRSLARALQTALTEPSRMPRPEPGADRRPDPADTRYRLEVADARQLPLDDASAHLVVTSAPYNARVMYDDYDDWCTWGEYWNGLIEPALREAYRILVPGGRLCLNLANVVRQDVRPTTGGQAVRPDWPSRGIRKWTPPGGGGRSWSVLIDRHLWALLEDIGFLPRERITWIKGSVAEDVVSQSTAWGTWCSAENPVLRAVAEPIYVASKISFAREPGQSDLTADEFKAWTRNAWFIPAVQPAEANGNPAAFPEDLPRRLIKLYSYPGDLVVDPFVGGGTTAVAAAGLGRRAYGCDIGPGEIERAQTRLARCLGRAA
ncbi:MAG: site-specific DNA-methyltransferase [Chloroflexota bacterium]|nr:site-specific DNA-methyltransferase [Chloroflexota bacterium]